MSLQRLGLICKALGISMWEAVKATYESQRLLAVICDSDDENERPFSRSPIETKVESNLPALQWSSRSLSTQASLLRTGTNLSVSGKKANCKRIGAIQEHQVQAQWH